MRSRLKSKKGVSLVELLAAMAAAGLLVAAILTVFMLGNRLFYKSQDKAGEHSTALLLMTRIQSEVQYAQALTIYTDPSQLAQVTEANSIYFGVTPYVAGSTVSGGLVIKKGSNAPQVYLQDHIAGYNCRVLFQYISGTTLGVTVTLINQKDGADTYTLQQDIQIKNINTAGDNSADSIVNKAGGVGGTLVGYTGYSPPT